MYTREIQIPVESPVKDGKPIQGTWVRPFNRVQLLDIARPYSLPLPKWAAYLRVKEWQSFLVQNDEVYFESVTANFKFFRFIEAVILDKKNGKIKHYFDYFPFTLAFWELPESLTNNFVGFRTLGYSMSIHNWLDAALIKFSFKVDSMEDLPELIVDFEINLGAKKSPPMVTNLLFTEDRPVYTYKNMGEVTGHISLGEDSCYTLEAKSTLGMFRDCKGLFPFITRGEWINAFGTLKDGRIIGFSMSENQAKSANKDNENVLWAGDSFTPLPPVHITHDTGFSEDWVIEDVEGMVDLSFTPQQNIEKKGFDFILAKAEFRNPTGCFNGMVKTADGEEIVIHNLSGCAESLFLRL
ncbi:MAG: DUF2804 domain-containing protein [Spirochaetaceae bacterium]|nr:DUF2804 domain-containing protein [Spirochaetaceae bacterium]